MWTTRPGWAVSVGATTTQSFPTSKPFAVQRVCTSTTVVHDVSLRLFAIAGIRQIHTSGEICVDNRGRCGPDAVAVTVPALSSRPTGRCESDSTEPHFCTEVS